MTIEIPQKSWRPFCDLVNSHNGMLMDIRVQGEGDLRLVVQGAVLRSLEYSENDDVCSGSLLIEFSSEGSQKKPSEYRVIEPIRLILRKESKGEHYNLLEMPAESGTTVIVFHPGLNPLRCEELALPAASQAGA